MSLEKCANQSENREMDKFSLFLRGWTFQCCRLKRGSSEWKRLRGI